MAQGLDSHYATMAAPSPPLITSTPMSFTTHRPAGRNAHIFHPPRSPASTTTTPSFATATDYFSSGPRKRQRPGSSYGVEDTSSWSATTTPAWQQCPTPSDGSFVGAGAESHSAGWVNERYRLAGGHDTPSLMATAEMERMQLGSARDQRRWRGEDGSGAAAAYGDSMPVSGPLARERNGIARTQSFYNSEPTSSWTGLAFTLVGKVFSFGTSVIRGFAAGGGKSYSFAHEPGADFYPSHPEGCSTPLPGSWQADDFLGDFEQDNPHSPSSRPPNKRRQTDRDQWIMVGTPDLITETSPRRKHSSTSIPRSNNNLLPRSTASRATSRRSLAPISRRPSSHISQTGSPSTQPQPQPPSLDRRASFAPMRSRPSSSSSNIHLPAAGVDGAYISPEATRYVKRRTKHDRRADAAMGQMSRRLTDLIRQGQEALGTKVSVEGEGEEDDEGFVDEDGEEWS